MNVNEASPEGLEELLFIYNSSRQAAGCFRQPYVELDEFKESLAGEAVYVARIDARVVGFVSVWVADRFVHHLYVLPEFQGQGIGSRLLEWCRQKYGKSLSLKCEVANANAQRFYRNKGWFPKESGTGVDGEWERLYSPEE